MSGEGEERERREGGEDSMMDRNGEGCGEGSGKGVERNVER